jgi:cytochrome c-type biogenesis protein CcmH
MRALALMIVGALVLCAQLSYAIDPAQLADPALQARYITLTHEFRCVTCQNQSIADSPVDLAGDLRRQVREMLVAGKSDEDIRDYMVARYGEFILFKPRFSARNALLWLAPAIMLVIGAFVAARIVRQRAALVDQDNEPLEEDLRS